MNSLITIRKIFTASLLILSIGTANATVYKVDISFDVDVALDQEANKTKTDGSDVIFITGTITIDDAIAVEMAALIAAGKDPVVGLTEDDITGYSLTLNAPKLIARSTGSTITYPFVPVMPTLTNAGLKEYRAPDEDYGFSFTPNAVTAVGDDLLFNFDFLALGGDGSPNYGVGGLKFGGSDPPLNPHLGGWNYFCLGSTYCNDNGAAGFYMGVGGGFKSVAQLNFSSINGPVGFGNPWLSCDFGGLAPGDPDYDPSDDPFANYDEGTCGFSKIFASATPTSVPEPTTIALFAMVLGLAGIGIRRHQR